MSGGWGIGVTPSKRCEETRAHYAHEWYNPLRQQCPGGPAEIDVPPGPCWHDSGISWPGQFSTVHCDLLAGHAGAHQADRGSMGGTAVWPDDTTPPSPATTPAAGESAGGVGGGAQRVARGAQGRSAGLGEGA